MKYIYLIKEQENQKKLINLITKDFFDNYYSSSYYIRVYYQNAICNFGFMDKAIYIYLYNNLLTKKYLGILWQFAYKENEIEEKYLMLFLKLLKIIIFLMIYLKMNLVIFMFIFQFSL